MHVDATAGGGALPATLAMWSDAMTDDRRAETRPLGTIETCDACNGSGKRLYPFGPRSNEEQPDPEAYEGRAPFSAQFVNTGCASPGRFAEMMDERRRERATRVSSDGPHWPTLVDVLRLAIEAHLDVATSMNKDVADWCESVGPLTEALDEVRGALKMGPYQDEEDRLANRPTGGGRG